MIMHFNGIDIFFQKYWCELRVFTNFPQQLALDIDELGTELKSINENQDFVRIALAGSFSCGKSSFINAMLGIDIAQVSLHPTTKCQSDFKYGEKLKIVDTVTKRNIDLSEYKALSAYAIGENQQVYQQQHFELEIPEKRLQGIILSDTPGFTSCQDKDERKNSDYNTSITCCQESDYVFFVVSAKDGCLKEDQLNFIMQLPDKNVIFIVTMIDKNKGYQAVLDKIQEICLEKKIKCKDILPFAAQYKSKKNQQAADEIVAKCKSKVWDCLCQISNEANSLKKEKFIALTEKTTDIYLRLEKFIKSKIELLEQDKKKIEDKKESIRCNNRSIIQFMISSLEDCRWGSFSTWKGGEHWFSSYTVCINRCYVWDVLPEYYRAVEIKKELEEKLKNWDMPRPGKCAEKIYDLFCKIIKRTPFDKTEETCFWESNADKLSREWNNQFRQNVTEEIDGCLDEIDKIINEIYDESTAQTCNDLACNVKFLKKIEVDIFDNNEPIQSMVSRIAITKKAVSLIKRLLQNKLSGR